MIKRWAHLPIAILLFYILSSCDPSNFQLPDFQTDLYLPILDVELSVEDLILADSSEILEEDSTGLVSLVYSVSDSRLFEEMVIIEDQKLDFTIPGISSDLPDFQSEISISSEMLGIDIGTYSAFPASSYSFSSDVDIEAFIKAEFVSGLVGLSFTNNFPFVLSQGMIIELINQGEEEPTIKFNLDKNINPGDKYSFPDADLAGKQLTGVFTFSISNLSTPGGNDISIEENNQFIVGMSFIDVKMKSASFLNPDIELPSLQTNISIVFPTESLIQKIALDSGTLSIDIPSLNPGIALKITLPTAIENGDPLAFEIGSSKAILPLNKLELDLSTGTPQYNLLPIELQLIIDDEEEIIEIEFDRELDGVIELSDLNYNYMYGYLGKEVDVFEENMELDFFQKIQSGTLEFSDPQITVTISNGLGVSCSFFDDGQGLYIKGSNERLYGDKTVSIGNSLATYTLLPSSFPGEQKLSELALNKTSEPEFGEFLSVFPTTIEARIPVLAGTEEVDMNQFIDDQAVVGVNLGVELPMSFSAENFVIMDTVEVSIAYDPEAVEVQSAMFNVYTESYFPIVLTVQNLFLDADKILIDSLFSDVKVIEPASINALGKVTTPTSLELIIEVDAAKLDRLRNTVYAVPIFRLQTPEGQSVSLLSSYNLKYKVTGEIITDINLNQ